MRILYSLLLFGRYSLGCIQVLGGVRALSFILMNRGNETEECCVLKICRFSPFLKDLFFPYHPPRETNLCARSLVPSSIFNKKLVPFSRG